ncbi:MAG: hypothetical protein BMS9Abin01_2280 [Gammaproteobacteria bacterium]|nr:MAG: hypothetical protein BMS9Abin01_2280 [Gammaproteobacteria bacterium]
MPEQKTPKAAAKPGMAVPKVSWDDSQMTTSYANVVNAASTREEVAIFFGTNQTWNLAKDQEVSVQLSNRIILNPFAAKRLMTLLGSILKEYESRYGALESGAPTAAE